MSGNLARRGAAAALALIAATACKKEKEQKEAAAPPPPEVPVVQVAQRDVDVTSEYVGELAGLEDVEIRARVEGYLQSQDYREGSLVKKGQLLFHIDPGPLQAAVAQQQGDVAKAEAALSKATLDVNRYRPLVAQDAIPRADLDNALAGQRLGNAQVSASRAQLNQAQLNLGYATIASPITGIAGIAERKVGDLVGKGENTKLTTVSSIDPIRAIMNIPEADYYRFANAVAASARDAGGAESAAQIDARLILGNGQMYPQQGRILLVGRAIDARTGTLRVDLTYPNPEGILRPGLFARVRVRTERRANALLVPQRAVRELQDLQTVAVVGQGDKIETRKVKTGPRIGGDWVIEDGLKAGEKVALGEQQRFKDGTVVKPVAAQADQAAQAPEGGQQQPGQPPPPQQQPGQQQQAPQKPPPPPAARRGQNPPRE
jgi:RND family efflux transporter MFP subunit